VKVGRSRPGDPTILTGELEGGDNVSLVENEVLLGPDEGAYLPALEIHHKVTAEATGGRQCFRPGQRLSPPAL
jgi:hypothetical protein